MQSKCEDHLLLTPNVDQSAGLLVPWVLQQGLQTETEKKGQQIRGLRQVVDELLIHRVHRRIRNMIES